MLPQKPRRTRLAHAQRFEGAKSLMLYPKLWSFQPLLYDLNIGIISETESSLKGRWNTLSPSLHRLHIFPINVSIVYHNVLLVVTEPSTHSAVSHLNRAALNSLWRSDPPIGLVLHAGDLSYADCHEVHLLLSQFFPRAIPCPQQL